jgi:hypothetical protein
MGDVPKILHAMHDDGIKIAMYSVSDKYVLFENGAVVPITQWLDENEFPVETYQDAAFYEFGSEEMGFGIKSIDPFDYEMPEQ